MEATAAPEGLAVLVLLALVVPVVVAALVVVAAADVVAAGREEVAPPMGAVEAPSIRDWTSGGKVPVMPERVNLAEKARAGIAGAAGSLREMDSKRMK